LTVCLGTPHLQGYVVFTSPRRLSTIRKYLPGAHWYITNGSPASNTRYCTKCCDACHKAGNVGDCSDCHRIAGPWTLGECPADRNGVPGYRSSEKYQALQRDLDNDMRLVDLSKNHFELYLKHSAGIQRYRMLRMRPRDFKSQVAFLFGPANSGKTYFVTQVSDGDYWMKPKGIWFDGYDGQEHALYDDFVSTNYGKITDHLSAFDKYSYQPKVHFGFCQWRPRYIWITSNLRPDELFPKLSLSNPALVKAFWSRVEVIDEFKSDRSHSRHKSFNFTLLDYEWNEGNKRV
jgi:hypothetical protein